MGVGRLCEFRKLRAKLVVGVSHSGEFFSRGAFDAVGDEECADLGGGGVLVKHQAHGGLGFGAGEVLAGVRSASDFTEERSEFVTHGFGEGFRPSEDAWDVAV